MWYTFTCIFLSSHRVFVVLDQGVPDGAHGLLNSGIGVKLVAVQLGDDLGQEGLELLTGLGSNRTEPKRCPLYHRQNKSKPLYSMCTLSLIQKLFHTASKQ